MPARISREQVLGFEAIALENSRIRAVILPQLGGRVWELHDLAHRRQWIWHREGVALTASAPGSRYDDVWAGGWEELFPNDAEGDFEGKSLPDHGEWWSTEWKVASAVEGNPTVVRLSAETGVRRTLCTKEFRLSDDVPELEVRYRIESREPEPFHFLFKQHLALTINPACRLVIPAAQVTPVQPGFGTLLPGTGPFTWPVAEGVDLSLIPARSSGAREFLYLANLSGGWCGIEDAESGGTLRMSFDQGRLPYLWLFLSYGGWRDCYTAVLEPCTNMPKDLAGAVRAKQAAWLAPGESFETSVTVSLGDRKATR